MPTKLLVTGKTGGGVYIWGGTGVCLYVDSMCSGESIDSYGTWTGSSIVVALRYTIEWGCCMV